MAQPSSTPDLADVQLRADIDRSLRHPVMFFFTTGALWLAAGVLLGLIASAKKHMPGVLESLSWFDAGKVDAAHLNVLIYGWAAQAAFGIIIWLMARLSRKVCQQSAMILFAGHLWNGAVLVGTLCILAGYGSGVAYMEMPGFIWPVLLVAYLLITIWSLIQFQVRDAGHVYISQWYLLGALFWFPWIFISAGAFVFLYEGHPLMAAGIASWFRSALFLLFFLPVAIASAYYLAPKVSGRPVHSYSLAIFGFWSLAFIAPWAGMQKLTGAPIPQFLPYVGAAAAILMMIPAILVGANILNTVRGHATTVAQSPSLRFTIAGIVAFILFGLLSAGLNISSSLPVVQFSYTGYGMDILSLYGVFSLCAFGAIYFIVPRITKREWLSSRFISWHFLLSLYGVGSVVACAIVGGYFQGVGLEQYDQDFLEAAGRAQSYGWGITIAWFFIFLSNTFFGTHLLLMWARLGRRSSHPTLLQSHEADSPHGPEGEVDNYGVANGPAAAH